jgi:predicted Zn-dependent peptidase
MRRILPLTALLAIAAGGLTLRAQEPAKPAASEKPAARFEDAIEARVHEHVLANGLRLLVVERHEAPVVSFVTMANVGAVDEHVGMTGVAHIFEHMAFKGSKEIGTTDYAAEEKAMQAVDEAFEKLTRARVAKRGADEIAALAAEFDRLQAEAGKFVVNNEYSVIMEENGGSGLNASTNSDSTQYFVSLPSNKVEMWFQLEADRFETPVLREFYKEKNVVMEERRMRTESSPAGRLEEEFDAIAFKAHPYGYPVIGHASDIAHLRRSEAADFYRAHYCPNNLTIAVVGAVDAAQCDAFAEKYFGRLPRGPEPRPVETEEPPQAGEKRVEIESPAQPIVMVGWHKCAARDADEPVFEVMARILGTGGGFGGRGGGGRASRFQKSLVKGKQVALSASASPDDPGQKYPNLFVVDGQPAVGKSADELEAALEEEVAKLTTEPVSEAELARVKTLARAATIRGMGSNRGIAMQLCRAQTLLGDWHEAFRALRKIEAVQADDILRVAKKTFTKENRVVARAVPKQ